MPKVESSNIAAIDHNGITRTLRVEFRNGTVYNYANVETSLYDQILKADSIGSAFHKEIKSKPDRYPYSRVQ